MVSVSALALDFSEEDFLESSLQVVISTAVLPISKKIFLPD
jgi:hypothetical protein